MASLCFYFVGLLVLAGEVIAVARNADGIELVMEEEELLGLFDVLGGLLDDPDWAQVHPQPCTDTPWPGVQCEIDDETSIFHATKIHIGPDIATPPCKKSAALSSHSLLKLPYLKTLSIFKCFVSSPVTLSYSLFGAFSSLEHLSLESNPALTGLIPSSLGEITSLRVLSLSQNNLQGEIPRQLGGLANLNQLDLSYNNLSGEIPQEIGGLTRLSILDLSWNGLEGKLPSSLGQLRHLQKIDLGSNRLVGGIPQDLGKLEKLVLLDLSHNLLNGPISETLSGLEQLQYLLVDHNPINSTIPLFVGKLGRLTSISFSDCGLTGPIPNSLSSLSNLTALSLDDNNITGTVPPSLGSLPNLDQLNLSHNQLSGELLLPEHFIYKLGDRLDVRGNSGLCSSNKLYRESNITIHLETPACMGTSPIGDNNTCPDQEHPDDNKGATKPLWFHGQTSSKAPWLLEQRHHFVLSFVICVLNFSL